MLRRPRNKRFSTMGGFLERHLPRFLLHCQVSIIININHHHRNHNLANLHNHRNRHHHHWEDFLSCTNSDSCCCTVLGCKIHHLLFSLFSNFQPLCSSVTSGHRLDHTNYNVFLPQLPRLWSSSTTNLGDDIGVRADPCPGLHLCCWQSP